MTALEFQNLVVNFGHGSKTVRAVKDVSFTVPAGSTVGLLGESGSGKSTLARVAIGLERASSGEVLLDGKSLLGSGSASRRHRRAVQMVFQDPYSSLNPRMTIGDSIIEGLRAGDRKPGESTIVRRSRHALIAETHQLLELVGLDRSFASRYPQKLSGGQRQRVALARALGAKPSVLLADEMTSALDVSVQGTVLNLFRKLQSELGLTSLFISHNLAIVRYVCDFVAVMDKGNLVEFGAVDEVLANPQHPSTRLLIEAVPQVGVPLFEAAGARSASESQRLI
ncbi:peptide/nickel transport system ATP-binding protein [Arthrobacter sp. yr096]|uniref:ABC transporter ATP-binding protein n=1 Tax=Arthrobacter sp. yr096 TaxID=1761750 RepID=UPI0008CF41F1|nr:ABC transporter ATP-binding protein [Arthrobacter sp. yr096]SEI92478.1 peptide/nickel transport system ATP-binding protein [Arthrobacter sp. yr096]